MPTVPLHQWQETWRPSREPPPRKSSARGRLGFQFPQDVPETPATIDWLKFAHAGSGECRATSNTSLNVDSLAEVTVIDPFAIPTWFKKGP